MKNVYSPNLPHQVLEEMRMVKYLCPKCQGKGKFLNLKAAKEKRNPRIKQAFGVNLCDECKGTGRVDKQV